MAISLPNSPILLPTSSRVQPYPSVNAYTGGEAEGARSRVVHHRLRGFGTPPPVPLYLAGQASQRRLGESDVIHTPALLLSVPVFIVEERVSFRKLAPGDSAYVEFTSTGCFEAVAYEFEFRRAAGVTAQVAQVNTYRTEGQRLPQIRRLPLGTVSLTEHEVAGLDRLVDFYRARVPGGCTTVDRIRATESRLGVVKAAESLTDSTCMTSNLKDVTLLESIAARLKPKKW